jgi:hypothetical protein
MVSGALIFIFAFRIAANRYQVTLSEPITVRAESRTARKKAVAEGPALCRPLEEALRSHPGWYHFDRFIHTAMLVPPPALRSMVLQSQ